MNVEPKVQIGDHVLTEAQTIAVRVAVTGFGEACLSAEMRKNLGPIADAYSARLAEVVAIMLVQRTET